MSLKIRFDSLKLFNPENIFGLEKVVGLYFISTTNIDIQYPFGESKLIYIGMSERVSNSIASRLKGHYDGTSENQGLMNYRKVNALRFTYINFDSIRSFWQQAVEDLESYFIQDFVRHFGVYPICNNKTGFPEFLEGKHVSLKIDWNHFN
jgi:hypothetical protein